MGHLRSTESAARTSFDPIRISKLPSRTLGRSSSYGMSTQASHANLRQSSLLCRIRWERQPYALHQKRSRWNRNRVSNDRHLDGCLDVHRCTSTASSTPSCRDRFRCSFNVRATVHCVAHRASCVLRRFLLEPQTTLSIMVGLAALCKETVKETGTRY